MWVRGPLRSDSDDGIADESDATPPEADHPRAAPSLLARALWTIVGAVCVAVGAVGIIVPGLPTTIFFIGAAAAFSRSSPRLEAWVLSLPTIGPAVRDYRAGLGMPRRAKIVAIAMIVVFVGLSVVLIDATWLRVVVGIAGVVGVIVVLRVPTKPEPQRPDSPSSA
ncbi:MAG: YbaN family protein [Actinomycetota bacterium]